MINNKKRLENLESYSIFDSLPEEEYDNLTKIASQICGTPVSYVSFLDDKRQWYKSKFGMDIMETKLEDALCTFTVENAKDIVIVPDMRKDPRFKDNKYVKESPNVVFYAGMPLISPEGHTLGTMCVLDFKPNALSQSQEETLKILAKQILVLLELRKNEFFLKHKNAVLENFKNDAKNEIEKATNNILLLSKILKKYNQDLNDKSLIVLDLIKESTDDLKNLIGDLD